MSTKTSNKLHAFLGFTNQQSSKFFITKLCVICWLANCDISLLKHVIGFGKLSYNDFTTRRTLFEEFKATAYWRKLKKKEKEKGNHQKCSPKRLKLESFNHNRSKKRGIKLYGMWDPWYEIVVGSQGLEKKILRVLKQILQYKWA